MKLRAYFNIFFSVCLVIFLTIFFTGCKKEKQISVYKYYETEGIRIGRITGSVLDLFGSYYICIEDDRNEIITISTTKTLKDFQFIAVVYADAFYPADLLYVIPELPPEIPFQAQTVIPVDMPRRGISFLDEYDRTRYFYISKRESDDSLLLQEFFPLETAAESEEYYFESYESEIPESTIDDIIYTTWAYESGLFVYFFAQSFFVDFGNTSLVNVWGMDEEGHSIIERTGSWNVPENNQLTVTGTGGDTYYFSFYVLNELLTITDRDNDTAVFRRVYPLG